MTAVEFWETMVACVLMTGNGYARKDYNGVGDVISCGRWRRIG
jgi:phage portal protein BeeE